MDLTRYFDMLSLISKKSFSEVLNASDKLFVNNTIFYIIGKIGDYQLLPALSIFITYLITSYMTADFARRENIPSKKFLLALLFTFSVLPFPLLASNIICDIQPGYLS